MKNNKILNNKKNQKCKKVLQNLFLINYKEKFNKCKKLLKIKIP